MTLDNVSTMDMDIDKTTFYQSVDIAGPCFSANSLKASRIDVTDKSSFQELHFLFISKMLTNVPK
jgi:hypothetical protein